MKMKVVMLFLCLVVITGVTVGEQLCSPFSYHEALLEKMVKTEFSFETLKTEFKQLRQDMDAMMGTLKSSLEGVQKEQQDMLEQFAGLKETSATEIETFNQEIEDVVKANRRAIERLSGDLKGVATNLENNLTESLSTPMVGFKATHLADTSPSVGDILVFPTVLLNLGSGYDSNNGVFTAPVDGLYLFTVQICFDYGSNYMAVHIMVQGKKFGVCNAAGDVCNSADAIVSMKAGDGASIKQIYRTEGYLTSRDDDETRLVSFSGTLLNKGN